MKNKNSWKLSQRGLLILGGICLLASAVWLWNAHAAVTEQYKNSQIKNVFVTSNHQKIVNEKFVFTKIKHHVTKDSDEAYYNDSIDVDIESKKDGDFPLGGLFVMNSSYDVTQSDMLNEKGESDSSLHVGINHKTLKAIIRKGSGNRSFNLVFLTSSKPGTNIKYIYQSDFK